MSHEVAESNAGVRGRDLTSDALLDGRLTLNQPRRGHRFGHDAVLLAAAVPARRGETVVELGAGVGAAALALAWRAGGARVALIERDEALVALARRNIAENGLSERAVAHALDVLAPARRFADLGLAPGFADHVMMNPPFNDERSTQSSPHPGRRSAHSAGAGLLATWVRVASRLLGSKGTLTLIYRADALGEVLAALAPGFGSLAILPVHSKPDASAIRIVVHAIKASRGPLALLAPLVLTDAGGGQSAGARAILRDGAALACGDGRLEVSPKRS